MSQTREESEIQLAQYVIEKDLILNNLVSMFMRQSYFTSKMCIRNNFVANDNVSNLLSQFDFWFVVYLRHFHFRSSDWYSNPDMDSTDPNLAPPDLNRTPVSPNLGSYKSSIMHWRIDLRQLYFIKIELSQCLWFWNDLQFNQNYPWIFVKYVDLRLEENRGSFHDHKHWGNFILSKYKCLKSTCQYQLQSILGPRLELSEI